MLVKGSLQGGEWYLIHDCLLLLLLACIVAAGIGAERAVCPSVKWECLAAAQVGSFLALYK